MSQTSARTSTILIADDEPNIRRVLEAMCTKEGHTVLTAENGKKALDLASNHQIDMLISDLIMPDMSGVEVLQKVKQLYPHCSAIIVTAMAASVGRRSYRPIWGVPTTSKKPFDMDEVRLLVRKGLEHRAPSVEIDEPKRPLSTQVKLDTLDCISDKMNEVYQIVERVGDSRATVLIRARAAQGKS